MAADSDLVDAGQELAGWLTGQRFGDVQILGATSDVIVDVDGYTALDVTVTAEDPAGETWSDDGVSALRRALRDRATHHVDSVMVYLSVRPRTDESQPDDEVGGEA